MRTIQPTEHYTDQGDFAVVTRTSVREYAQLVRVADRLCRNAEELLFSKDQPTIDNCCIAGEMLGLTLSIAPERIGARFDF
jgi:hypothetical protein